jgi:hypothetical protein
VLGVDASSGCSDNVGVDSPGGRVLRRLMASLSTACVSKVSVSVNEAAEPDGGLGGVEALEFEPTVLEKRLDAPSSGGTHAFLMPSVVLFSPAKKAACLSPPLDIFSIPSLAILSLVLGDISLGDIFLIPFCVELALRLAWPALLAMLADLNFLFRRGLLELVP